MKCILGIGNPGNQYQNTRHNIGFYLLDQFASRYSLKLIPSKFDFYYSEGELSSNPFVIIKPTTYVNNSGLAARQCLTFFNSALEDFLVVADDVNLQFGEIRLRKSGGDGGHNGMKSIIYHLNSDNFSRLRFGIGSGIQKGNLSDYVLAPFNNDELVSLKERSDLITNLIGLYIAEGYQAMLSGYSRFKKQELQKNRTIDENE